MLNSLKIIILILALIVLVSPAAPISSKDTEAFTDAGVFALMSKEYARAHELFEKAAKAGNPHAQTLLAGLYIDGLGVSQNYVKARYWLEKGAKAGNNQAQFTLGVLYENGIGGPQDYKKARYWHFKAVESGNIPAALNLGTLYYEGKGGPKDIKQAIKLWEKVATYPDEIKLDGIDGKIHAQNNLGLVYFYNKDYEKARYWFEKAAEVNEEAQLALGFIYFNGLGVPQNLKKSRYWIEKFVDRNVNINLQMALTLSFSLFKN